MERSSGHDEPQTSTEMGIEQPSLFGVEPPRHVILPPPALIQVPVLTPDSSLGACRLPYQEYLRLSARSPNTITCFLSDLAHLIAFLGDETRVREVTLGDLERWRQHLRMQGNPRGLSPAPKTVARRLTFVKNFFGWLAHEGVVPADPSAQLIFTRPIPPLPELLFEHEIGLLETAAGEDVRCQLLVMVLLEAGLKREELLGLRLRDVDLSDPAHPAIEVRFPRQDKRGRERRMALPARFSETYARYIAQYRPAERVFECTGRNLNYILAAAVRRAKLQRPVTLQLLRDVYAVHQLRAGLPLDALREKLGLSEEAWIEASEKYRKLATTL
jgi:integrase/recombinase XerD